MWKNYIDQADLKLESEWEKIIKVLDHAVHAKHGLSLWVHPNV